jgi:hypothetical protein
MKGAANVSVYGGLVPLGFAHSCLSCDLLFDFMPMVAHFIAGRNPCFCGFVKKGH